MRTPTDPAADAAHVARGGLTQLFGVIAQLLTPVYHVVVARLFGQVAFGIYQTSVVILELCTRVGWMGGDKAMHRFIAAHRAAGEDELARSAFGGSLRLSIMVSAVLTVALALSAGSIARLTGKPGLALTLPLMAGAIVPSAMMMILVAATLGSKITRINLFVRGFGEPGFLLLAAVIAFALGAGVRGLAAAHFCAYVATCGVALLGAAHVFGGGWLVSAIRTPTHPRLLHFAVPVAASELANVVVQKADLFILSFFVPDGAIAVYAASEFLGRIAANIRYALDGVAAPILSEALHLGDRERLRYNLALITRWVATLAAPLAATNIALRSDLLSLYGPGYAEGTTLVCIWTCTHLLNGTVALVGHVLMMAGRSRLYLANQAVAGATNVVLSLLLIPRFGMTGAAVSALVAVTLPVVAMVIEVWLLHRVHPFDPGLAKPFLAAAGMLVAQLGMGALIPGGVARVLGTIGIGLSTYAGLMVLMRLGREEREIVIRLYDRIRKR